ncbi:hypothetical protein L6R53_26905 [Myxococcota bacterium]|nr:hypothetical protein [Myxococcota bacterium]
MSTNTPRHATPRHASGRICVQAALTLMGVAAISSATARADEYCDAQAANEDWSGADCNAGGATNVCTVVGTVLECDLRANDDSVGAHLDTEVTAVYDGSGGLCGSAGRYCIFGRDVEGDYFGCLFDSDDLTELSVESGDGDDIILFTRIVSSVTYNLDRHTADEDFIGRAAGLDGNDWIEGSRANNADYHDNLNGNAHDDVICGRAGNDFIHGGLHDDLLFGEDHDDEVLGAEGRDEICGGLGSDVAAGGAGADDQVQCNGGGTDTISGGPDGSDNCSTGGDGSCEAVDLASGCGISISWP